MITLNLIKCGSRVVHKLFKKTMQNLSAKLPKGVRGISEKRVPEATASFAPPNMIPTPD